MALKTANMNISNVDPSEHIPIITKTTAIAYKTYVRPGVLVALDTDVPWLTAGAVGSVIDSKERVA